jgi:hypothetical protein
MSGHYQDLELGKTYMVSIRLNNGRYLSTTGLRFIQVTPKGFNFLDVNNHRCIFKGHFYRSNKYKKFFIVKNIKISKE